VQEEDYAEKTSLLETSKFTLEELAKP